jgi:hypothetical protein
VLTSGSILINVNTLKRQAENLTFRVFFKTQKSPVCFPGQTRKGGEHAGLFA